MSNNISDELEKLLRENKQYLRNDRQVADFIDDMYPELLFDEVDWIDEFIPLFVEKAGINIFPYMKTVYTNEFSFIDFSKFNNKIVLSNCLEIQENAFAYSKVTEIVAPKCVSIQEDAFYSSQIEKFYGPNIVNVVGRHTFTSSKIKEISFPKCTLFNAYLHDCNNLTHVELDEVYEVYDLNQFNAENLQVLILPKCKKLLTYGEYSKLISYGFKNLTQLVINKDVSNRWIIQELQKNRPKLKVQYV